MPRIINEFPETVSHAKPQSCAGTPSASGRFVGATSALWQGVQPGASADLPEWACARGTPAAA